MKVEFTILGEPKGKGRPRLSKWGTYTPKGTVEYENLVRLYFQDKYQDKIPLLTSYLRCELTIFQKIPKTTSKKRKELMLSNKLRPGKKPDLDNVAKIILDSLNNILYQDDKQVIELECKKYYSERPRVEVKFIEI